MRIQNREYLLFIPFNSTIHAHASRIRTWEMGVSVSWKRFYTLLLKLKYLLLYFFSLSFPCQKYRLVLVLVILYSVFALALYKVLCSCKYILLSTPTISQYLRILYFTQAPFVSGTGFTVILEYNTTHEVLESYQL